MSITDCGNGVAPGSRFTTSAGLMPRVTRNIVMSPTTLLEGHLHDVAKEIVDLGVSAGHFLPARAKAHALGLLAQVGVLAAGHFVLVNISNTTAWARIKRRVHAAHGLPVI